MGIANKGLSENEVLKRLESIIGDILKISQGRNSVELPAITLKTDVREDLGLDSIEIMDLIAAISADFGVKVTSEINGLKTMDELVAYILKAKK